MGRRIGLLGGTFDPPHLGHLWLAETARDQLELDLILFIPVGRPPHKAQRQVTNISHRLIMTRLAIDDNPFFALDVTDVERHPPHTTASLLPFITQLYMDAQFYLIIGADSLKDLPSWEQPQCIVEQCRLAVYPRPDVIIDWRLLETAVPGVKTVVDWVDGPVLDISSTDIRRWSRAGHSVRYLVPKVVLDYIHDRRLYIQCIETE